MPTPYDRAITPTGITLIDLFAGAGGLTRGFADEGFELVAAYDNDPAAVATHRANFGEDVEPLDLADDVELPPATVVAGGPPCQGFSSAGARRAGDQRNTLVRRFAEIVAASRPSAFVFENVEGFLTFDGGDYVLDLLEPLVAAGYRVHLRKVNAANFGVPQHRKRVLAIGGLGWDPTFPEPTHSAYGAPGAHRVGGALDPTPSLEDAIGDLPPASSEPPGEPPLHFFRPLDGIDLERARALAPGERMRDLPEELWHESYRRRAYRRVMDGTPTDRRGGAPAGLRRLRADEPSKAITGGARTEFLHPTEDRTLTLRECARVQTFPDDFEFCGTIGQTMTLIGNAVPPVLARVVARSLASDLASAEGEREDGALLTFVPTLSDGMSPALGRVTDRVIRAFQPAGLEAAAWR